LGLQVLSGGGAFAGLKEKSRLLLDDRRNAHRLEAEGGGA
jgi:hypothetical protein